MDGVIGRGSPGTRRLLDEPLRASLTTLVDSVIAYEAIRDDAGVIVDFLIVYANEDGAADVGLPIDGLVGRRMLELFPHVRDGGRLDQYRAVVDTGVPLVEREVERNGRWWDVRASRLGDGFLAVFRDISERKRIEHELLRARAAAESASRAKDEFLATVSHELRTPLTAVLGYLRMIEQGAVPPERVPGVLSKIYRNAQMQLQVIDDILDVSGIATGTLTLARAPLNPGAVLLEAIDTVRPTAVAKGVEISHAVPSPEVTMDGDSRRLHQVFWNVLANAVKFTPAGGRVTAEIVVEDGHIRTDITDTGAGIDPAFLPRLFDPFTQGATGTTREYAGLGLGLAIVHHLVTAHGGTITAASDGIGRGSTFRITFPRAHSS